MFDIRTVRDDPAAFDADMARRGLGPQAEHLLELDGARRRRIGELEAIRAERKAAARRIGAARARGEDAAALAAEATALKARLREAEEDVRARAAALAEAMRCLPNRPAAEAPDGAGESANVEIRRTGEPRAFDFAPRPHYEIGEALGQMDFERAAAMSGARFVVLQGPLARLHRALAQFMLDLQTGEHGYLEVAPPFMVREHALFGTGQLPKFAEDNFVTTDGYWPIPTAEVPLTNMARERILDEAALPLRLAAHTPCFRAEAGAAGKDTRGMVRVHQFEKVELVSIAAPDGAADELERMTGCAEEALRRLELPWRRVLLCAGDTGFSARKTFDLEVWLPGQNAYREISSCSECGDFQARRMNARYRPAAGGAPRFVHTLNGSGLAVGRALVAVLENFQNADGSVAIPDALRPWMGGRARIAAE